MLTKQYRTRASRHKSQKRKGENRKDTSAKCLCICGSRRLKSLSHRQGRSRRQIKRRIIVGINIKSQRNTAHWSRSMRRTKILKTCKQSKKKARNRGTKSRMRRRTIRSSGIATLSFSRSRWATFRNRWWTKSGPTNCSYLTVGTVWSAVTA